MRFEIIDVNHMRIEHGDNKPITVYFRDFTRARFVYDQDGNFNDPFKEINDYIADMVSNADQDKIYEAYSAIFAEFELLDVDVDILIGVIQTHLKIIYDIVHVQDIHDYLEQRNRFNIPPNIKDHFTGEYDEDRTFDVRKFKGLISLAIAARIAIPVWGEFGPLYKSTIGANRIPIPLMKMLIGTSILESAQFKEYEIYSNSTVDAGSHKPELIAAGFGTEFNVNINLAGNFVKRVAVGLNQSTSKLANNIFNFTSNRGAYNVSSGDDLVWGKIDIAGEEEKSKIEKYALRERISQGDIVMIEYYITKTEQVLKAIDPYMTDNDAITLASKSKALAEHLNEVNFIPKESNLFLTQWIMSYIVPPKTITYMGFEYQREALAITVMLLRHWNFDRLSLLPISIESISADGHTMSHTVVRRAMPDDIIEQLDSIYPLKTKDKAVANKDKAISNMAVVAINEYYTTLNNTTFKLAANTEMLDFAITNRLINRHFSHSVKPTTPIEIAQLLLKIHQTEDLQSN